MLFSHLTFNMPGTALWFQGSKMQTKDSQNYLLSTPNPHAPEAAVASLATLSSYIESAASVQALPLIIDEQELTPQARLDMYVSIAARSNNQQVMETAFALALRTVRSIQNAAISSAMPTASKLKACETPILNLCLEFAARSADWRALIVKMMADNVTTGSGHLSVNRAKQVLKEIAKRTNFANLTGELKQECQSRRTAAIYLLGWLKHEKALEPLIEAYERATRAEQAVIIEMLEEHYMHKLPFHMKWRCANRNNPSAALSGLMQLLALEA